MQASVHLHREFDDCLPLEQVFGLAPVNLEDHVVSHLTVGVTHHSNHEIEHDDDVHHDHHHDLDSDDVDEVRVDCLHEVFAKLPQRLEHEVHVSNQTQFD